MIHSDIFLRAFERRGALFNDGDTNCFRLFNSAGDGLEGVSVDLYGEYLLLQFFTRHMLQRRHELCRAMERAVERHIPRVAGILAKDRGAAEEPVNPMELRKSELLSGVAPPDGYLVRQNGVTVAVDLVEGQHTGIFLDMRTVRRKLLPYYGSVGTMLNLFSYTAVFSVHALLNGAKHAVNVDLSKSVLRRARRNYELNGLSCDARDFIAADAHDQVKYFIRKKAVFDMAVYDPPTFSRNRKRVFSIKRDYADQLALLSLLLPHGYLLTAVNTHAVSRDEYLSFHPKKWELVFFDSEPDDFPYPADPYLKVGLWRVKGNYS